MGCTLHSLESSSKALHRPVNNMTAHIRYFKREWKRYGKCRIAAVISCQSCKILSYGIINLCVGFKHVISHKLIDLISQTGLPGWVREAPPTQALAGAVFCLSVAIPALNLTPHEWGALHKGQMHEGAVKYMLTAGWQQDVQCHPLHQNSQGGPNSESKCESVFLHSQQNVAEDQTDRLWNDSPLLAKSLMRKYWLGCLWIERQRCLAAFALSPQQYDCNWIINSTLMESWEYWGFSFLEQ